MDKPSKFRGALLAPNYLLLITSPTVLGMVAIACHLHGLFLDPVGEISRLFADVVQGACVMTYSQHSHG